MRASHLSLAAAVMLLALLALTTPDGAAGSLPKRALAQQVTQAVAKSVSTGSPSQATAVAKDGEKVTQIVVNGVVQSPTSAPAPATGACGDGSWAGAPVCNADLNTTNFSKDSNGRLWGFEAGCSCKYLGYCSDKASNVQPDTSGRLWGWENGTSCKFP